MSGYLFTTDQSVQFFEALRAASVEFLKHHGLPIDQGRKRYKKWEHGRPIGVTSHFTAGVTWKGSIRWLNDGSHKNSVSCQMMILDRMLPEFAAIIAKYPELKDLKVVTLLISDGVIPCWQAGWVNRLTFGIEKRNAGCLRGKENDWRWWAKGWKAKFPYQKLGKVPLLIDGKWWEPYTYGQVHDEILVCQHLHALYQDEGGLDSRWILPHSATTGTKWDTGRAYPINDVRDAIMAQMPIEGIPWLQAFGADPAAFVDELEEEEDQMFLQELEERQAERTDGVDEVDSAADGRLVVGLGEMPAPDLQDLVQDGVWREELDSVRRALHKLGYVTGGQGPELDEDTALAVYQFQRSEKELTADKIPGDKTQRALYRRLADFQLQA
jgi:hypothetical protein